MPQPTAKDTFRHAFFRGFLTRCYEVEGNNTDFLREAIESPGKDSPKARLRQRLIDGALVMARNRGIVHARSSAINEGSAVLECIVENLDELDRLYARLDDDHSRGLMVELLQFRVLGRYRVKLSRNDGEYREKLESVDRDFLRESGSMQVWSTQLGRYELPGDEGPISFHGHQINILNTFLLRQYEYQRGGRRLRADAGDVVVDAGGCWGDTALYFADQVGAAGRVLVLEFVEENLKVLQSNLNLNASLAPRIQVVPKAAWDCSGETLPYSSDGAATTLRGDGGGGRTVPSGQVLAATTSIDDLVTDEGLSKVDYIKMDIEGAELRALQGAERTIRTYRPKLAISVYHTDHDLAVLPRWIDDLDLDYSMYLDHFTIHREETMLFAWPRGG